MRGSEERRLCGRLREAKSVQLTSPACVLPVLLRYDAAIPVWSSEMALGGTRWEGD